MLILIVFVIKKYMFVSCNTRVPNFSIYLSVSISNYQYKKRKMIENRAKKKNREK